MKISIIKIYVLAFLLLLTAGAVSAQNTKPAAKVSGSLLDEQGKPLDYATVTLLKAQDSTVIKGTLSNQSGDYLFDHINSGSYIIRATVVGYKKASSRPFTVTSDAANFTVPVLKLSQASKALNTVNVISSKPLIERKIDRTVMNVENSVLAAGNTALEILERAPGVSVDKDDNISLKGSRGLP